MMVNLKKYKNIIFLIQRKMTFDKSTNSHQLECSIFKSSIANFFINKYCHRHHCGINRLLENILIDQYIAKNYK